MKRTVTIAAVITIPVVTVTLGFLLATTGIGKPDTGHIACTMMQTDKRNGTTPDTTRSAQELNLLTQSRNADLRQAGQVLSGSDLTTTLQGIGPLYAGCATVGVPLT